MNDNIPPVPPKSFRVTITLNYPEKRIDNVLLVALRDQNDSVKWKNITRGALKELFIKGKVMIKGQKARPSSALAKGITYVDILL